METLEKTLVQQLDAIIEQNGNDESNLLQILLAAQDLSPTNHISTAVAAYIASQLEITLARVSAVISFFAALSAEPRGRYVIKLCRSTACMVNGSHSVRHILERELGVPMGQTTPDGLFSLEHTECIGACDVSPAMRIGKTVHGNLTEERIVELLSQYREGTC